MDNQKLTIQKKCCKCKKTKNVEYFFKNKSSKDGFSHECKECCLEWYKNNPYKKAEQDKKYRKLHKVYLAEKAKRWRENNPTKVIEIAKRYRENHKDKCYEVNRKIKERMKIENPEKFAQYNRDYYKNRINSDPKFRLRHNISGLITKKLRRRINGKNRKSSFTFLSYTIDDLYNYLEKQFKEGMNWNNYGKWHIDHIIPDVCFYYTNMRDKEFQKSWSLENLQPLWAQENYRKPKYLNKDVIAVWKGGGQT